MQASTRQKSIGFFLQSFHGYVESEALLRHFCSRNVLQLSMLDKQFLVAYPAQQLLCPFWNSRPWLVEGPLGWQVAVWETSPPCSYLPSFGSAGVLPSDEAWAFAFKTGGLMTLSDLDMPWPQLSWYFGWRDSLEQRCESNPEALSFDISPWAKSLQEERALSLSLRSQVLMDSDPGLRRRFSLVLQLEDYTAEELAEICALDKLQAVCKGYGACVSSRRLECSRLRVWFWLGLLFGPWTPPSNATADGKRFGATWGKAGRFYSFRSRAGDTFRAFDTSTKEPVPFGGCSKSAAVSSDEKLRLDPGIR